MNDTREHDDPDRPSADAPVADVRLGGPLDLRVLRLPPWLSRRTVTIEVGDRLRADDPAWRDEIVSVEEGAIEIAGRCGLVVRLEAGAVLYLDGLPQAEVRCISDVPAVLVAIHRRRPADGDGHGDGAVSPDA